MRRYMKKGVHALRTEAYMLPAEAEKSLQKSDRTWWSQPWFIIFLTISLSALDAAVLYSLLDMAMVQAAWLGIVVTAGIALVLNIIPMVVAKLVQQAIYKLRRGALTQAVIGIVMFALLFSGTVCLRFAYQEVYANDSGGAELVNTVEETVTQEETKNEANQKSFAVVVLLSVEPLVTSVLAFMLAFRSDDELKSRINRLRRRKIELQEAGSDLRAALSSMEGEREQLLALDEQRYLAAQAMIHTRCDRLRAEARFLLSEHLREASAITKLSAEATQEISSDGNVVEEKGEHKENLVKTHQAFPVSA